MTSRAFRLDRSTDLSPSQLAALRELHKEAFDTVPPLTTREMEWSTQQWHITTWEDDKPTSHVGIVIRAGTLAGVPVTIGGISDVGTAPSHQREGLATGGLEKAMSFLAEQAEQVVDFGLLVCRENMVPFYAGRGWRRHSSTVWVTLFGERTRYTFSPVMVQGLALTTINGEIDLCGPPW